MNLTQSNVMANDAILCPPPATKTTAAPNQSVVNSDLEWLLGLRAHSHNTSDQPPELPDVVDEIKKARAEKRLDASLMQMEIEQKARLLAEMRQKKEQARREFESKPATPYDSTSSLPSTLEDMFQAEKEREELIAMEREQKAELLRNTMESLGRECGGNWQLILANPETSNQRRQPGESPIN